MSKLALGMILGIFTTVFGYMLVEPVIDYYQYMHSADGILEAHPAPPIKEFYPPNEE